MDWHNQLKKNLTTAGFNRHPKPAQICQVDIIIPVYNGVEALKKCLAAVLKHTTNRHHIHLLNDASTDPQVKPLLEQFHASYQHIHVLHRAENLGYLHNVNQAIETCRHDVVVLNADTVVTAGWLDEMQMIAADQQVGVVCPVSDNATLLSIKNHRPQHLHRLKQLSGLWYPIPTAVGFCMLLKRTVLESLGGFDPYYHPGYGEECDYSMRVRQMGLQIAAAPAAFVYHQGSQSFQDQATKLQSQHNKLLSLRWPEYDQEIAAFAASNPAPLIDLFCQLDDQAKGPVLHVVHGLENQGGVELFTRQLLNHATSDSQHVVLTSRFTSADRKKHIQDKLAPNIVLLELPQTPAQGFIYTHRSDLYNEQLDGYFTRLLMLGQFNMVHFHSLVGMGSMLWPHLCQELHTPYAMFFHDHFGLCQIYSLVKLTNGKDLFCGKTHLDPKDSGCHACIQQKTRFNQINTPQYIRQRDSLWQSAIEHSQQLFFSSTYLLEQYRKKHPAIGHKAVVFEPCFLPPTETPRKPVKEQVNVAFLGHFTAFKGAAQFLQAYDALVTHQNIKWYLIGGVDQTYSASIKQRNIHVSGSYQPHQLSTLLKDIDLVLLCSVFPESYSITLSESLAAGVPVIAPDIGAFPSRLNHHNGWLFKAGDGADLALQITAFIKNLQRTDYLPIIKFNNPTGVEQAQHLMQSNLPKAGRNFTLHNNETQCLPKPQNSGYDLMAGWLEAPATLEAGADWATVPNNFCVCLLGNDPQKTALSLASIEQQLPQVDVLRGDTWADVTPSEDICLLITNGCTINENIGNWAQTFSHSGQPLGLADHALTNHQGQVYAPQFQHQFSWINHSAMNQTVGCVMVRHQVAVKTACAGKPQPETLAQLVAHIHQQQGHDAIHYFPHFSWACDDQYWATNWKQLRLPEPKQQQQKHHVLAVVRTELPSDKTLELVNKIKAQNGLHQLSVAIITPRQLPKIKAVATFESSAFGPGSKAFINTQVDRSQADFVWLLNDNVHLNGPWCLHQMLQCLLKFPLDVVSPPAARSKNNHELIANKAGGGLFFYSKGVLSDTTFHPPNHPVEHNILDDDCALFTVAAWQQSTPNKTWQYYEPLARSLSLGQQGYRLGIIAVQGLVKFGLPSYALQGTEQQLRQERAALTAMYHQSPTNEFYSAAYSNRSKHRLDLAFGGFKTPKNLPRVIAYAHDSWGSGFYRIKSPLSALAANNKISTQFLPEGKNSLFPTPAEVRKMGADVMLLHNCFSDLQLASLAAIKNQLNIPLILSMDDLMTEIPEYNPAAAKSPKDLAGRIRLAFQLADRVLVSSQYLAQHHQADHPDIITIANHLSQTLWPLCRRQAVPSKPLRVGWAGAGQHQADIAWLTPVIQATQHVVQWVFFGDQPAGLDPGLVEYHQPVPFQQYQQKLQALQLDIGLAPLLDNPFNRAKSNLKLIEYAAVGAAVICSDLEPYQNSPAMKLAHQPDLWIDAILSFSKDRSTVSSQARQMLTWVKQNHLLENHLDQWSELLGI